MPSFRFPSLRTSTKKNDRLSRRVEVIAHRGSSGKIPAHTLPAYEEAVKAKSDWIEFDCHACLDGHLVIMHDVDLSLTTDVETKFPERKRKAYAPCVDGEEEELEDWFVEDFTLSELKSLKVTHQFETRRHRGRYATWSDRGVDVSEDRLKIVTVEEAARRVGEMRDDFAHPNVGLYIETKRPNHYASLGLELETRLVNAIDRSGFDGPIIVQSFERESLETFLTLRPNWKRVQLLLAEGASRNDRDIINVPPVHDDDALDAFFENIATYANGVGPHKSSIIPRPHEPQRKSALVAKAHRHGMFVHPYTFRSDLQFLPSEYNGNAALEFVDFFELGVDGVFTDFPSHAVFARAVYEESLACT